MTLELISNDAILETRHQLQFILERALGIVSKWGPIVIYPTGNDWAGCGVRDDQVVRIPRDMISETYEVTRKTVGRIPEVNRVFVLRCPVKSVSAGPWPPNQPQPDTIQTGAT